MVNATSNRLTIIKKIAMDAAIGMFVWYIAWSVIKTESVQCRGRPRICGSR